MFAFHGCCVGRDSPLLIMFDGFVVFGPYFSPSLGINILTRKFITLQNIKISETSFLFEM